MSTYRYQVRALFIVLLVLCISPGVAQESRNLLVEKFAAIDTTVALGLVNQAEEILFKNPVSSITLLDSALALDATNPESFLRARMHSLKGIALAMTGDPDSGLRLFHQVRRFYDKEGNEANLARVSTNLANVHQLNGRTDSTCFYMIESLHHTIMLHDTSMLISNYANMAAFFLEYDDLDRAKTYVDACLNLEASSGLYEEFASIYQVKGYLETEAGRYDAAEKSFLASDERAKAKGDDRLRANLIRDIAAVHSYTGKEEDARASFNQALERAKEVGVKHHVAGILNDYALFEARMKNEGRADSLFNSALSIYDSLGAEMDISDVLLGLAKNEWTQESLETAIQYASRSLELAEKAEAPHRQIACLELLTSLAREKGDEHALQTYDAKLAEQMKLVQEDWDLLEGVLKKLENSADDLPKVDTATPAEESSPWRSYLIAALLMVFFSILFIRARKKSDKGA